MNNITQDLDSVLSLGTKRKLLKEIGQEDLLNLFKQEYQPQYSIQVDRKAPLDQQVNFTISKEEKDILAKELYETRRVGPGISISAYVRNRITKEIDLKDWADRALLALKELSKPEYDIDYANKQQKLYMKLVEDAEDKEEEFLYQTELDKIMGIIENLKKQSFVRKYRLSGRITFQESNIIRWRAARLSLSLADYMRYMTFDYLPNTQSDLSLSLNARKRFYVSILDVYKNGWGEPAKTDECPNCARYIKENVALREQLHRFKKFLSENGEVT